MAIWLGFYLFILAIEFVVRFLTRIGKNNCKLHNLVISWKNGNLYGGLKMNEYINLTLDNIDEEHICCAIGDKKHQAGVDSKKEWIKNKLKDGHIFRKLNARGKIFIEYEPIETAWIPISGKNYEYIYCLWVAGSFKGKGIGKELLEYAINDSKEKGKSGICTLVSKKKKPFIGEKNFFEHYGFKVIDTIEDYELIITLKLIL